MIEVQGFRTKGKRHIVTFRYFSFERRVELLRPLEEMDTWLALVCLRVMKELI